MSAQTNNDQTPVYLLVVDVTDEFSVAVDYASAFCAKNRGRLALLNVIEPGTFDHWLNIENKLRKELREHAENAIWDAAKRVSDRTGKVPMICIEEGERSNAILDVINRYPNICMLILAGESHSSNPGPLVSYFSGKGLQKLRVPLLVVPGHLELADIEGIV